MKIRFSTRAFHHLEQIHAYIARDNWDAASETIEKIMRLIDKLADHPQLGRPGNQGTRASAFSHRLPNCGRAR